jgi:phosphatidylglycerol:prolipoprotein diacylglycerol transferase
MHPELLHIYGPISIQPYGLMVVLGIVIFAYLVLRDVRRPNLITKDQFFDLVTLAIGVAILGGRLLFLLTNRSEISSLYDAIAIWDGGFSILGSVIGILLVVPLYLKIKKIDVLQLLDLAAVYAPLLQAIARIGCFWAGCCYGSPTSGCWAIKHGQDWVHPAQLYSSGLLFCIFFIMIKAGKFFKKPGQLAMLYLILESVERFVVDFWRGDREFLANTGFLGIFSVHQCVSMGLATVALIIMVKITAWAQQKNESV